MIGATRKFIEMRLGSVRLSQYDVVASFHYYLDGHACFVGMLTRLRVAITHVNFGGIGLSVRCKRRAQIPARWYSVDALTYSMNLCRKPRMPTGKKR